MKEDAWKERFLSRLAEEYNINPATIYESGRYRLLGLPFFNHAGEYYLKFKETLEGLLKV